jgi:hypothetical protein
MNADAVESTADGGHVVAGWIDREDFPTKTDGFVMKLDADGNVVWARTYEGHAEDILRAIHVRESGYVVAGQTDSFGAGETDVWLLGLDDDGDIEWQRTYGMATADRAFSIAGCRGDGYIAAGQIESAGGIWALRTDEQGQISSSCPAGIAAPSAAASVDLAVDSIELDFVRAVHEVETMDLTHPASAAWHDEVSTQCGQ